MRAKTQTNDSDCRSGPVSARAAPIGAGGLLVPYCRATQAPSQGPTPASSLEPLSHIGQGHGEGLHG